MTMDSKDTDLKIAKNTGTLRFVKALRYSFEGLASAFRHEAAFRQELIMAAVLIPLSFWMGVSLVEHLLLVISIILVMTVELINSAIEAVVDDISLRDRPLAKRAKDMGSAAVLMSLFGCAICWVSVIVVNWEKFFG